ncbi:hypothetical protein GH714_007307 [Hevea brasiliensis]|uniref:RRM domain-containing protein n=1 Tax=Hevea brasiliensis TaxID=3981 RepID=A0A6A6M030_HEVBR|nr:hypothetical protein GH714_007307 [Hevea brasiliensis]
MLEEKPLKVSSADFKAWLPPSHGYIETENAMALPLSFPKLLAMSSRFLSRSVRHGRVLFLGFGRFTLFCLASGEEFSILGFQWVYWSCSYNVADLFVDFDCRVRIAWMGKTIQVYGFPSNVTVDEVKDFLESYTGEGTVYAMKIREKGGPRKYAIVQFTTVRAAEYIISLTNESLWHDTSYLKARVMDTDIVPKPRTCLHSMEHITLHFGCQISKEEFYVLWKGTDVSVNIEFEMKILHFFSVSSSSRVQA